MTLLDYLLEWLRNGYRNSKYEKEAYDKQKKIQDDQVPDCKC